MAKEPGLEFSCSVGAKPDPNQQLYLASHDCSSKTASIAPRSLPMSNSNVPALVVLGQTAASRHSLARYRL